MAGSVALLPATIWIAHGSVDWLWEYPALSGPALALAGGATALAGTALDRDRPRSVRRSQARIALACLAGLVRAAGRAYRLVRTAANHSRALR